MATANPARLIRARWGAYWLPRQLHPLAWWLWALGLSVAASRTINPLLLGPIIGVACWVVLARRSDAPWANAFRLYVWAGVLVVVLRVVFRIIFGGGVGETVLIPLPTIELPSFMAGITLFGDITVESLLAGFYDGLRLATMLICVGAANALADPKRLLRSMPPALHEVSTAVVVALSVFPQLAESVVRVTRARRLRPGSDRRGIAGLRSTIIPVLEDALDRSLVLAASMDSRGYGRTSPAASRRAGYVSGGLLVLGLCGLSVGVYAILDGTTPRLLAGPMLVAGVVVGILGIALSGRGVRRTRYRPDSWRLAELLTVASGLFTAAVFVSGGIEVTVLFPSTDPLGWPGLSTIALGATLVALLPAFVTPMPPALDQLVPETEASPVLIEAGR